MSRVLRRPTSLRLVVALALVASAAVTVTVGTKTPPAAAAAPTTFSAAHSQPRKCHGARTTGRGVDGFAVTATSAGLVRVRLQPTSDQAVRADWDVAVFDAGTGSLVAASAAPRSYEVADGFVTQGQRLWVQGCRYAGSASRVSVSVAFFPASAPATDPSAAPDPAQLVTVRTRTRAQKRTLLGLGLDVTESATPTSVDVVLHGRADGDRLRRAGLGYRVKVADLGAQAEAARRADRRYAARTTRSDLPSGRTSYRLLADYDYEMKELARRHPSLVKSFTLDERSVEGRDISGVEITDHVRNTADGKPVFLNLGVHHAREWPSGEHAMEWAYELVQDYKNDARARRLIRRTRNIVVPVVNVDGFSASRNAVPLGDFSQFDYEDQRKNCRPDDAPTPLLQSGICPASPAGTYRGTDLNRNYGAFWGGPGASPDWDSAIYRGPAPFSEPESRAVRDLIASRQVTNLITNHTFSNLVLRPPGVAAVGKPVDEPLLAKLGQSFADKNGYANLRSFQLYDTSGTTDDWSYWLTGSLSYTFEIGATDFHPAFADGVVAEYLGRSPAAGAGKGGNRGAYFAMLASTARTDDHATITGRAPKGWKLRLHKEFQTPTAPVLGADGSPGPALMLKDTLDSRLRGTGKRFSWAVNPSTRPYVAGRYGRTATAPAQAAGTLTNPAGDPSENVGSPLDGPHEEATFTVGGPPAVDNGSVTVRIAWSNPDTDWDLYLVDADGNVVGQSATFGTNDEQATLLDPVPGTYRAVVVNYDQVDGAPFDDWTGTVTYASPEPPVAGVREAWTLTCQRPGGSLAGVRQVIVDRGQTVDVGRVCDGRPYRTRRAG